MDYDEAIFELTHKRTKKPLQERKLCNKTHLERTLASARDLEGDDETVVYVNLVVFGNRIMQWRPNGNIIVSSGNWHTRTTIERFQRYLPHNFRLRPSKNYWQLHTPNYGIVPWTDGMVVSAEGKRLDMPAGLEDVDGLTLLNKTRAFVENLVEELARRKFSLEATHAPGGTPDCHLCHVNDLDASHLWKHVLEEKANAWFLQRLFEADGTRHRPARISDPRFRQELLASCWSENAHLHKAPRGRAAQVLETERVMLNIVQRKLNPWHYRKDLKTFFTRYLLNCFGFEHFYD
jgi:hypothetical protein